MLQLKKHLPVTSFVLPDDGVIPNSRLPVIVYHSILDFVDQTAVIEELSSLVEKHDWQLNWTWRIYKFTHWHSTAHEGLACIAGGAWVLFGGPKVGRRFYLSRGDVAILPAGVSHQNISSSDNFKVCGFYPKGQKWDLIRGARTLDHAARRRAPQVPMPSQDPLQGSSGPLLPIWKQ